MIGERLKMARRMAGMSQQNLGDEVNVSRMAISKYERDIMAPSSDVLIALAQALDVRVEYLLRPVEVTLSAPAFRKSSALRKKDLNAIVERTREWLERYLAIESLIPDLIPFSRPATVNPNVKSLNEIEDVALDLRHAWDLGTDPIDNLMEVLESRGIKVGLVQGENGFDALTLRTNDESPVLVVRADIPGDRQRLNLAHELGHLILNPSDALDEEKAAFRFGAAFLVPAECAYRELGRHRRDVGLYELHLLKHKYGLSIQAWIYRAKDLGIISQSAYNRWFREFSREGWRETEPGDQLVPEQPQRMKRLVLRALAEDVVSHSRAAELLGKPLSVLWEEEVKHNEGFPATMHC